MSNDLKLSAEPTAIKRRPTQIRAVIYGDPGVGKTTFGLSAPRTLFIDTEGGLEGDAVLDLTGDASEWSPSGWADLNAVYFWIKERLDDYDTIVVDTLDALARFILNESIESTGKKSRSLTNIKDLTPQQADYQNVSRAIDIFINMLRRTGKHIILLAHLREPDVEQGRTKRQINLSPAAESVVEEWANVLGELAVIRTADGNVHRVLHVAPSDPARKTKSRFYQALGDGVVDPTFGKIINAIEATNQPATN